MLKNMIVKCTSTNAEKYFHGIIVNCQSRNITSARPMYLHIETTSICNAKCVMCAHSQMKRPKQIMNDDLFEKIVVGTYNTGIKWVNLQFFGEPLTDKDIFQRIRRLKEEGFKVKFNTNASLLNEDNCVSLFNTKNKD